MLGKDYTPLYKALNTRKTSDCGFAFAGTTAPFALLVKLDSSGNAQWNRTYPNIAAGDTPKYGYINYPIKTGLQTA